MSAKQQHTRDCSTIGTDLLVLESCYKVSCTLTPRRKACSCQNIVITDVSFQLTVKEASLRPMLKKARYTLAKRRILRFG